MLIGKRNLIVLLTIGLILGCEHKDCGCIFPPSPLAGNWSLVRITYGLSQKTVTAAEAGYSETLSFNSYSDTKGTYKQVRNGMPLQTTDYELTALITPGGTGLIYFSADSSQQSFRLTDNKLYLSERTPRGATLADGSTYEYQRE